MWKSWVPRILQPNFTWPRVVKSTIPTTTPSTPRVPGPIARRRWGIIHGFLYYVSERYCHWLEIPFNPRILELPFGLILKWTGETSIEEVAAMQIARAAGMPVPLVLCCGEHPHLPHRQFSILMTRLPGVPLRTLIERFDVDAEGPWVYELEKCVHSMRSWDSPTKGIASPIGTSIRSLRVPGRIMGPFETEKELHKFLRNPASSHRFRSMEGYEVALSRAKKIEQSSHRITFTHGDFKTDNILIDSDGHLSGFLGWGSAGWYPEYWEFTTAMRPGNNAYWYQVASWMGGDRYLGELASDNALHLLTMDSYAGKHQ